MARLSGCSVTRSSLFPARAMMMFSLAWRWSSLTHAFALSRDDYNRYVNDASCLGERVWITTYSLCDVVDYYCAVRIPVVHGRQRLVALLPGSVPDFKFDCRVLVEGDGLCEEGGANGRFSVRVELVLAVCQREGDKGPGVI